MIDPGDHLGPLKVGLPRTWADVLGQEQLTSILRGRISDQRDLDRHIAFAGPSGAGKMMVARLYSLSLVCLNPTKEGGACHSCTECNSFPGSTFAYIELDAGKQLAATSVDDAGMMRQLVKIQRSSLYTAPRRVIVINNAEQLSMPAADVALKTLEREANTVFIFVVNEMANFSGALRSRCQVFQLKPIQTEVLIAHLGKVCDRAGLSHELSALRLIAQASSGWWMTALRMLARLAPSRNITLATTRKELGLDWAPAMLRCWEALFDGEHDEALSAFESVGPNGPSRIRAMQAFLLELFLQRELGPRVRRTSPALDVIPDAAWVRMTNGWARVAKVQSKDDCDLISEQVAFWGGVRPEAPWRVSFEKGTDLLIDRKFHAVLAS